MKGCPLLDVQISRTGLKNAAAYTTGLHPFTPALPPQTALATTGGRKLSNDSTPQNFTLQHAGGRPSTVDYEQLAPSAFPSAQAPIAATVHSNPKADFAVDGTHGILTDRLSNIQQQVGAQPLSFRNVQQVEQATQEPDASTTSSSSSIPLPADNITTTRQSASGVRPATSSSTSIAFSMATGNSSFMQTTKQGPIDTDGLLTFRHGGMLACTYSNIHTDLFLAAVVPPVAALSSLRYADFWALSATGCVPLSALVKYVAVCVRVCWYCHQSGGTDVVDLPDILLPAGQYLDLFDSESETDVPSDSSDEELVEV